MAYIKKLSMQGFKSFVRKTELPFNEGINVVLGPNGSGKSNISDALCFVLGRLSIKSMRAAKAKNLIFMGNKQVAPSKEASVELIFENKDRAFAIETDEVTLKRIVRKNGQSIYKINDETKTRQEVISLLAQAGIDPNGFNIILQGEIQGFVKMHPEERRKIIEEVSGISIYEARKEKTLRELEKTEERLKEVGAILRERTAYLNNLEKERQQALKYKKLESMVKVFKASIISHGMNIKKKEQEEIIKTIEGKQGVTQKYKKQIFNIQTDLEKLKSKINSINSSIQKASGLEQEKLNSEITDLKASLIGLTVRKENYENKIEELQRQIQESNNKALELEKEMKNLQKETPLAKTESEVTRKKAEFEKLEEQRKKFYMFKSEAKSLKERIKDKQDLLHKYQSESDFLLKQINNLSSEINNEKALKEPISFINEAIESLRASLRNKKEEIHNLEREEIETEKKSSTYESEIERLGKVTENIGKIDICPLCKSKITPDHIGKINKEIEPQLKELKEKITTNSKEIIRIRTQRQTLSENIDNINNSIMRADADKQKVQSINEKKNQLKELNESLGSTKNELNDLEKRFSSAEEKTEEYSTIEQKYETARIEIQEMSSISEENLDSEISFKKRELERIKISLKQFSRTKEDLNEELSTISKEIMEKEKVLDDKKEQEEKLNEKFKKMFSERDSWELESNNKEKEIISIQSNIGFTEQETNNLKIEKAKIDAEYSNFEMEMLSFQDVEIIKGKKETLIEKLNETQETLSRIGSVNLRSLEVYDSIKKEYDSVQEKVDILNKEKEGIIRIIHEIDVKKKKAFLTTLFALNEIFSRNFMQLSVKGQVSLELEDKKDPFAAGVNILVKVGKGKFFDVTSLSGGEQTLVALSLIFAIQEHKPYYFYILDEIDAALDKRNSARLAELLKRYMKRGQYIVITHNDEVISNATTLYGVSMHDGISKVVSLKL